MSQISQKLLRFTLIVFFISHIIIAQCTPGVEFNKLTPKRDLRGVFIASVYNLNWPTSRTASPDVQQAELKTILDNLKANNYNTVFLQVRSECDALYKSTNEPWSRWLTGTQGLAPSVDWDPLAFAITEAHNRGLDLHAWLNPYRARTNSSTYTYASTHITNTQPTWCFAASNNANLWVLNPGLPAVRNAIETVVADIANRYDVDGIHYDDYFYPNGGMASGTAAQDYNTFLNNNPKNTATIEDWRRDNVNQMIAESYDIIQNINTTLNKNIVFGVSPFGIWKSGTPSGISGNSSFSALYCDPIAWLTAGKVDYLAPQLYWKITGAQDYIALSKWWNDQIATFGNKHLYVSQGYYKMSDSNNWAASEIQAQINQNRVANMTNTFGQIAYSYTEIKNNSKSLNTTLLGAQFQYKSFAPPITGTGKDNICPNIPANIRMEGTILKWDTPIAAVDGDLPIKYVVYTFDSDAQAITNQEDGSKILDIVVGNQLNLSQSIIDTKRIIVSALDKNNNEAGDFTMTLSNSAFELTQESIASVYPNPFNDQFTVSFKAYENQNVELSLYDLSGRKLSEQSASISNSKVDINPSNLTSGIYFIRIDYQNGVSESFKIIKQ